MVIDQRNAGAAISAATLGAGGFVVDRMQFYGTQSAKFSAQQNQGGITPPAGFTNYAGLTVASAYTVGASDIFGFYQWIEGYNVADLGFGSANANTITVSAWVYSSLTGQFGGTILNSAQNRSYPFSYTIPTANTWTQISVTIVGDTSGTWLKTNGQGMAVLFCLGAGSTFTGTANTWSGNNYWNSTGSNNIVGTSGATFYITGIQLEKGTQATSFEYRQHTTELQLCQRYTYRHSAEGNIDSYAPLGMGRYYDTNLAQLYVPFKVTMRTPPSSVTQVGNIFVNNTGLGGSAITLNFNETSSSGATVTGTATTGVTAGNATTFYADNTSNAALIFSAEL
jgi:hypothetical protein